MNQSSGDYGAVSFGPFRLSGLNGPLNCNSENIALRPIPLHMLWFLVNRPDQVITKEELLEEVWPSSVVSDSSLAVCISEIRAALGDDSRSPRYLQTIHRIGYRFIGNTAQVTRRGGVKTPLFVGRQNEMQRLHQEFASVANGNKRMVVVTGNPGFGKSSLLEHWAAEIERISDVYIFRGVCINHTSTDEPYSPFISALRNISRTEYSETLLDRMRRFAPDWLLQFPALINEQERRDISAGAPADAGKMRNELFDLLVAFSLDKPLILILDDMQWCDASSAVALSALMAEHGEQRILVIVASRRVNASDVFASTIGELKIKHFCSELVLQPLSDSEVNTLLSARIQNHPHHALTNAIYQRTQGHPLFTVALSDYLSTIHLSADSTKEVDEFLPDNLHTYIELGMAELTPAERQILETASVVGYEFSVAEIGSAVDSVDEGRSIEEICESLAGRGDFLAERGYVSWPDGTITSVYRFVHSLYPELIRRRIGAVRLLHTHKQIVQRLQVGYAADRATVALKLAFHCENANDAAGAAQCYKEAAAVASQRYANQEAIVLLQRGLAAIENVSAVSERAALELDLLLALGPVQVAALGYGATEVQATFSKARQLCEHEALAGMRFPVLRGLAGFYILRGEYSTAYDLGAHVLTLNLDDEWSHDSGKLEGSMICGIADFFRGRLARASPTLHRAIKSYHPKQHSSHAVVLGLDPGAVSYGFAALTSWMLGDSRNAIAQADLSLSCAAAIGHPFTSCQCHALAALLHQFRSDATQTLWHSDQAAQLAKKHGFPYLVASEQVRRGWVDAVFNGDTNAIQSIQAGVSLYLETDAIGGLSVLQASLIEACIAIGELELGLDKVVEALRLCEMNAENLYRAELLRLHGELLFAIAENENFEVAERHFKTAINLATEQQAHCFYIRATASLANLLRRTNRDEQASRLTAPLKDDLSLYATSSELMKRL